MKNLELKDLLFKIGAHKDRLAFKSLFKYFAPKINAYLIKTGTNQDLAEDLTQEIMTTIWNKAGLYDYKKSNVNTWIFTIARNKRIDNFRKKIDPKYNELDLISSLYDQKNEEKISEDNDLFHKLSQKLEKGDKELIQMNFFEGKTHKKISETLEIPLGTVKSRIRKVLTKLKEYIENT
tara:strand:+ start:90 stop:626 length:537 start_codon:yes stop_codon:yes gene_type:complete